MIGRVRRLRRGLLGLTGGALAAAVAAGLGKRAMSEGDQSTQAFDRGREAFQAGDYAKAAAAFSGAAENASARVDALVLRGMALVRAGRAADAVDAYSDALALAPERLAIYLYRAEALTALGEQVRAEQDLERALQLGRGDPRVAVSVRLERQRLRQDAPPLAR